MTLLFLLCVSVSAQGTKPLPPTNVTATVDGAPTGLTVPPGLFGMHTRPTQSPWPSVPFGSIRLWDTHTAWNDLEPSSGTYNWQTLDLYLNLAQQHNIDILYVFGHTAAWASSGSNSGCSQFPQSCFPPSNMQDWDNFVTAIATHAAGRIKYWEVWNEANASNFWSGDTATLVKMAQDAYKIIKSIDPSAVILSPSVAGLPPSEGAFLDGYFSQGGGSVTDIVPFHAHRVDANNPDTITIFINTVKGVLSQHGLSGKPLWNTEGGWRPQDTNFESDPRSPGYVAREYLIQYSNGVDRFYWYVWDSQLGWGTLWTQSGGTNAAGVAYGQLYNWLVGAVMTPCVEAADSTWTCVVTRSGSQGLIVWNSAGTISYTPASAYKQVLDLSGGKNTISGPVSIGYNPIMLTN
jgi:Glycosyl hydrolase family 10